MGRLQLSAKNATVTMIGQSITVLMSFACRMVFVRTLNSAYLGANGLFGDILSLLSLSELGIGSAIVYFMYEPAAKNDNDKLRQLLGLYKKLYHRIGVSVAIVGFGLTPFIGKIVGEIPQGFENLQLIYCLYVFNLVLTYFFAYQRSVIEVHQQNYVCSLYQYILTAVQYILQICFLITTHNFIIYLCIQVLTTFTTNALISRRSKKMYPELAVKATQEIGSEEKKHIFKNIGAMFMHNVGGAVVNGTDNILLTVFAGGLTTAGLYSNYRLIINTLTTVIGQVLTSITSSIGNLGALESKQHIHKIFNILDFADYWIFSFCTICIINLINPFISVCFGKNYVLSLPLVIILAFNFYLSGMRQVVIRFRNSLGLFWYDRYKAVLEAVINLVVSIVLAKSYGIMGVFLGTMISTLTTAFWIEPYVLYKYGFGEGYHMKEYFLRYINNTLWLLINCAVTSVFVSIVSISGVMGFFIKILICITLPNTILLIRFYKSESFIYYKNLLMNKLSKKI